MCEIGIQVRECCPTPLSTGNLKEMEQSPKMEARRKRKKISLSEKEWGPNPAADCSTGRSPKPPNSHSAVVQGVFGVHIRGLPPVYLVGPYAVVKGVAG